MSTTTNPVTQTESPTDDATVPWLGGGVWQEAVRASDSYAILLVLVVVDYFLLAVGWTGGLATVVRTVFFGMTAVLGVHTSKVRGLPFQVVIGASGVAVLASVVSALVGGDASRGVTLVAIAALALITPLAVLHRIRRHRQVTIETILGAVCIYVLLGLLFAYADLAVQTISSGHFFAQSGMHHEADFVYFSFITMTTVGYGDLSPTTGVPRTMAVSEALVGQVFLVVLVARLVAVYTPRSGEARRRRALIGAHAGPGSGVTTEGDDGVDEAEEESAQTAGESVGFGGEI
jgi:hypothetical protein